MEASISLVRPVYVPHATSSVQFTSFQVSSLENKMAKEMNKLIFQDFFFKQSCKLTDEVLVDIKSFCGISKGDSKTSGFKCSILANH